MAVGAAGAAGVVVAAGVNSSWNSRMFVVGDLRFVVGDHQVLFILGLVVRVKSYPGVASYPQ